MNNRSLACEELFVFAIYSLNPFDTFYIYDMAINANGSEVNSTTKLGHLHVGAEYRHWLGVFVCSCICSCVSVCVFNP